VPTTRTVTESSAACNHRTARSGSSALATGPSRLVRLGAGMAYVFDEDCRLKCLLLSSKACAMSVPRCFVCTGFVLGGYAARFPTIGLAHPMTQTMAIPIPSTDTMRDD
jgi:hypothetical protein